MKTCDFYISIDNKDRTFTVFKKWPCLLYRLSFFIIFYTCAKMISNGFLGYNIMKVYAKHYNIWSKLNFIIHFVSYLFKESYCACFLLSLFSKIVTVDSKNTWTHIKHLGSLTDFVPVYMPALPFSEVYQSEPFLQINYYWSPHSRLCFKWLKRNKQSMQWCWNVLYSGSSS